MTTLIITEKPSVAQRIASSIGRAKKLSRGHVPYYAVGDVIVAPTVGHIYGLGEKKGRGWSYPVFDIEWTPSYKINKASEFTKEYLNTLEVLAKDCSSFINACDYDIEGEVIGFNVIRFACDAEPFGNNVHRMKYSTLTEESIRKAYNNLEPINRGMANAGIVRHTLDWFWGINLSRALSLAIRRARAYTVLSIGRVQGPALKLLTKRESEIRKFKPVPYWMLELIVLKDKKTISAFHKDDKIWDEENAKKIKAACGNKATVSKVDRKKAEHKPPAPFDLTTLQTEAYKQLGIDPRTTLQIAQELYTNAYISYPRTSSQQIPKDINCRKIIEKLRYMKAYVDECNFLLKKGALKPNNGPKKDPAHPAIHPTGEIPEKISAQAGKIYDLIVRRFLATFGDSAVRENTTVEFDCNKEIFIAKGVVTLKPGWYSLYGKYSQLKEIELPPLNKGEVLDVKDIKIHKKETQPPKRYTPASIIREMEKRNLGTKATRSQILDTLFKRGYVSGKSIEVTTLGMKVVETLDKYCPEVLSEKLTRGFEEEMVEIENGKTSTEKVVEKDKETLTKILKKFKEHETEIGASLAKSFVDVSKEQNSLGKCLKCNGNLVMRKSRFRNYFVGCDNYPKCNCLLPLPRANLKKTGKCKECGYAILTVLGKKRWSFCINPECPGKKK